MSNVHKYIYWRPDLSANEKGELTANIHLLVGYTNESIASFRKMADQMRVTFPQATDEEVHAGKIKDSRSVRGFSIVWWTTHLPRGSYPGWTQIENGETEYSW